MALPLMLGICLVAGVACFLTDRATKASNKVTHDGGNVNSRPPAPATTSNNLNRRSPATSSNNLNRRSPAAPATSSDNLNRRPPAPATSSNNLNRRSPVAPATSSDTLNRRSLAPATSSDNLNRWPPAPATSSDNDLNRRSPAEPAPSPVNFNPLPPATSSDTLNRRPLAPATSSDNLNRCPPAPATSSNNDLNSPADTATSPDNLNCLPPAPAALSDNLNPRPLAPATSSNNPVMHVGDMAAELAKYEVCPFVHSTDAVGPVVVHLQTNVVQEVKINELSNCLAEGLENNDVFKVSLGNGLGPVTVVDLELDDNIDVITPLIEEADVLKLEEEVVNSSGGVIGSGEGWWVAVKKWVEERFRWVKGKVKKWVEEPFRWVKGKVKKWVEERFWWGKGKGKLKRWAEWLMLDPAVRRTFGRLVWVVVDSMVESKYGIGPYRVLLKMYRILINELRCH